MLSVEKLKIVPVGELKPGEIARLPDQNNALVLATLNDRNPFVFLERAPKNFELIDRHDFYGPALVYKDVSFEIDTLSGHRSEDEVGCLSLYRGHLQLAVKQWGRETYAVIRSGFEQPANARIFFKKWRAVIRAADSEHVLFEHEVGSQQHFVLEVPSGLLEDLDDVDD